ncbi:PQQ-binding-like beta-propeller repeat protein [Streptomyces sp. NPDC050504]|uniref:outer membrane protein assembly factor BamB family protein n=1 Tax=Streptomyces sp. NPDC050504 TaxID=3365618 RepID=UPI0037977F98
MTQPPQPPNQPPQGGYGGPNQPPQGPGYGYPQTPPAQPPAQPPAPPAAPPQAPPAPPAAPAAPPQAPPAAGPGYGYPQQPAPGQQAAQAPYNYPTAPMQPMPAPGQQPPAGPGAPGGIAKYLNKTQLRIVVAATAAIALIIGGGAVYSATKDDGDKTSTEAGGSGDKGEKGGKGGKEQPAGGGGKEKPAANVNSKLAFQLPVPVVTDLTDVFGSWATDKVYAKPGVNSIVGYDALKGTQTWKIDLPGQPCQASRHVTKDNKTAILFEAKKRSAKDKYLPCDQVGAIDLNTGKLLWSKTAKGNQSGDEPVKFDEVTLSGTTVAAGGLYGGAGFDVNTGAVLWNPDTDAQNCHDIGYSGGDALVAVRRCGRYGSNASLLIQPLGDKGKPISSFKMPAGVEDASIVNSKPLVVAADINRTAGDGSGISDFFSVDYATGKLLGRISAPGDKFYGDCEDVEKCNRLAVGNNKLYVPTEKHEATGEEYGRTNEILSFDLATGKPTSDKFEAGGKYTMWPLRMDGNNVIAYKEPPYDKGGQVVSIDPATGKQTVLMENPADEAVREAERSFLLDSAEIRYAAGRLYISDYRLSKDDGESKYGKKYLALAFATN